MPRCPHCNYTLVLLEHRRKYKCPRCSRLYPQKEIDTKDFVEYNKRERKSDKEALTEKKGKQKPLTDFEKKQGRLAYQKNWRNNHPDYYSEKCKEYYNKNKEKILVSKKEFRKKNGKALKERLKSWKNKKIEEIRALDRISKWRRKQKELAQHFFEFEVIKPYNAEFEDRFPTLSLS